MRDVMLLCVCILFFFGGGGGEEVGNWTIGWFICWLKKGIDVRFYAEVYMIFLPLFVFGVGGLIGWLVR